MRLVWFSGKLILSMFHVSSQELVTRKIGSTRSIFDICSVFVGVNLTFGKVGFESFYFISVRVC